MHLRDPGWINCHSFLQEVALRFFPRFLFCHIVAHSDAWPKVCLRGILPRWPVSFVLRDSDVANGGAAGSHRRGGLAVLEHSFTDSLDLPSPVSNRRRATLNERGLIPDRPRNQRAFAMAAGSPPEHRRPSAFASR